jgi:hypothetical protein
VVVALVNQGTIAFLANAPMLVEDARPSWAPTGGLAVAQPAVVGLYAVPAPCRRSWSTPCP